MARDPNKRTRVLGSGNTVFMWEGQVIGFANSVTVEPPVPVADPVVIQPLNAPRPVEIVTAGAHRNGIIRLTLTELYNRPVWDRLAGLAGTQDLVDIMRTIAARDKGIEIVKRVKPHVPGLSEYSEHYYNCVVARVNDGETIDITTMEIHKELEVWYTHSLKLHVNGGRYRYGREPITS